jgi:hypothetical protein
LTEQSVAISVELFAVSHGGLDFLVGTFARLVFKPTEGYRTLEIDRSKPGRFAVIIGHHPRKGLHR